MRDHRRSICAADLISDVEVEVCVTRTNSPISLLRVPERLIVQLQAPLKILAFLFISNLIVGLAIRCESAQRGYVGTD